MQQVTPKLCQSRMHELAFNCRQEMVLLEILELEFPQLNLFSASLHVCSLNCTFFKGFVNCHDLTE